MKAALPVSFQPKYFPGFSARDPEGASAIITRPN